MHLSSTDRAPRPPLWARSSKLRRRLLTLASCCLLASVPRPASAQDSSSLEALIQEGIRLRRDGDDEKALDVFRQAERLQPSSVRVLLHLATAAQAAGHWVEADTYIRRVFEYRDDPYYRRYQSDIAMVEQIISARIGRFQVVGSPKGAEVRLNGRVVGRVPMDEPERLEAGNYQLEVVSNGHYALRRPQRIPAGVLTREVVELGPERAASSTSAAIEADSPPHSWWSQPWLGWTLAGASAASLVTAGVAFSVREQQASRWNDDSRCVRPGGQTREQQCGGEYGDARLAERIGITASIGAVVFGGAAALQFLTRSSDEVPERFDGASAGVKASCTPGWLGVSCEGRF
ncbi:MAG TPA: PEGA domain-containing protein [Polyangiaceae bacterium]|nr:PEGA domain-containing protein [Polyangiaceae bacterium]